MEIKISQTNLKTGILSKITLVLFGIFLASTILAINLQLLKENGIVSGIISNALVVALGLYYTKPLSRLRLITWSILTTTALITIGGVVLIYILKTNLEGF